MDLSGLRSSAAGFATAAAARAPAVVSGLVVLLVGWILARLARRFVSRALASARLDVALQGSRIQGVIGALGKDWSASRLVGEAVYLTLLLITANAAAGQWGLTSVQVALQGALSYLPKVLGALGLLAAGTYVAGVVKRSVGAVLRQMRSPLSGLLEMATEAAILLIVGLVAFDVLGVNLGFITSNLTLVLGGVLLVIMFLGCWAMRGPSEQLVANYYLRRMMSVGDYVENKSHRGTIVEFVPLGLILREAGGDEVFIPARELLAGLKRRQALRPDSPAP